ncbi:PilW family protein [Coraliomargarita sinensis]|uniref:PilW family protein n=1 Tax=Coraliomargarita sinensis TaxID=2174842 RepID=UPI001E436CF3|nr:prepilin-type N-terminal cleavage/methylation domain-containing protein [Coraliomargarita sinensis]
MSTPRRRSAFTLIEIMVAAVITVIMIGLVVQITSEVLKIWNRSVGKLSANAEARIAMELLTSDLETALLVNNGQQWMRVEAENTVGNPTVGQTVGLKLFAPALDRPDEPGNICAIAYRLAYAPAYTGAKTNSFVLFRSLEGPRDTFDDLLGPAGDGRQLELVGDSAPFWADGSIIASDNYLAGNIVDFKIYVYGEDDAGEEIILNDIDENGIIDQGDDYIYGGNNSSEESPTSAEIFLTVVSDEGLEILALFADPAVGGAGTGFDTPEDVILQHGEVFKRRVYFQAKPL